MTEIGKARWVLGGIEAHLAVVLLGAAHLFPNAGGPLAKDVLVSYGVLTGANAKFGFFAPSVRAPLRARYVAYGKSGEAVANLAIDSGNREVALRMHNILLSVWTNLANRNVMRALSASLCGKIFATHSEVFKLDVIIEAYALPTMRHFATGQSPAWRTVYEATYERNAEK